MGYLIRYTLFSQDETSRAASTAETIQSKLFTAQHELGLALSSSLEISIEVRSLRILSNCIMIAYFILLCFLQILSSIQPASTRFTVLSGGLKQNIAQKDLQLASLGDKCKRLEETIENIEEKVRYTTGVWGV